MNDTLVAEIQKFTLSTRAVLERETDEQLQGIYGWLPDGSFADASHYPAIQQLDDARETRLQLERYAEEEQAAGFSPKDSRHKLKRETAFTWLNRLVAFRLFEERKLLKQTVTKIEKSNGFIYWLTTEGNEGIYQLHQQGDLPLNPMGEGPSNVAYRRFINWQSGDLARVFPVLFDPSTLPSHLFPRPAVIKQIVAAMNAETLVEAWMPGNEETLGWVYEGFIEDENKAVFEKFSKGKKVLADEIGPATQRFTPRWIVRFLVENSLGRIWIEMHPDSRLKDSLTYLVPVEKPQAHPLKLARNITFLDPSCGSMHFGLVAFDLFVDMYREEFENIGQPGWPEKPSVTSEDDIAASIIAHNLHGIDIDLRSVQISALTLFLRARTLNPKCAFTDRNLACANVEQISGGKLDTLIAAAKFSHPIYERVLRTLAAEMKDSDQLGSLLRLERSLERLVAEERRKVYENKQFLLSFPGVSTEQFDTQAGIEEFFDVLTDQLQRHLDFFVRASRETGSDPGHIVSEAAKGLRYMQLVSHQYDVVATNPPYMSRRNMSEVIAKHLDKHYSETKGDLYAAFIARCLELVAPQGKVAMVTQQSFMFIGTYEKFRSHLRSTVAIETMAHLGPKAFPNITGEKVNTTAFVLCREPDKQARENLRGVYFRLVREKEAEAKRVTFEGALSAMCSNTSSPHVFTFRQIDFDTIPEKPWIYWMPEKIQNLFRQGRLISIAAPPKVGLQTGKNARFVRKWWEVGFNYIDRITTSCVDSKFRGGNWFPYMKGGAPVPWYGNQEHVVNWKMHGQEIRSFVDTKGKLLSRPQNTDFYFRRGVTWSDVSPKGFAGRLSPGGFIHDVKGMTCYPSNESLKEVLGIFNSTAAKFILSALNPTISFQVGDIERLPIPSYSSKVLEDKVEDAVTLTQQDSAYSEMTYDFIHPPFSVKEVEERHTILLQLEEEIDQEVTRLYGLIEADRLALKSELEGTTAISEIDEEDGETEEEEETLEGAWNEASLARAWVSYAFGTALGRYRIGVSEGLGRGNFDAATITAISALIDSDGIMPADLGHPQDIVSRTISILELMRGEETARSLVRAATGGDGMPEDLLRGLLERFAGQPDTSFWRFHFQRYRKRPIFWPLQSPKRKYTIWIFQERFTTNSLFEVRRIVEERLRLLEREIADKRIPAVTNRALAKELDKLLELSDDLRDFSKNLQDIIQTGYTPHIDDGVLLNAAPLHTLLPSWPETKKAWLELADEKYDWAQQAMDHWPERVKEKCKTNKSFAIAHGLA